MVVRRLYITDNPKIALMLTREGDWRVSKELPTLYERKTDSGRMVKLEQVAELRPESIIDGSFKSQWGMFFHSVKQSQIEIINSFSPSQKGNLLYQLFLYDTGLMDTGNRKRLRYLGEDEYTEVALNGEKPGKEALMLRLRQWSREYISKAITENLYQAGINLEYDMYLTPIYAQIEQRRIEIENFEEIGNGEETFQATMQIGNVPFTITLCDKNGKPVQLHKNQAIKLEREIHEGFIVSVSEKQKRKEISKVQPYDFLSLLQDLSESNVRISELMEILSSFYANGYISYPFAMERKLSRAVYESAADLHDLSFLPNQDQRDWLPASFRVSAERMETAGGIVVMKNSRLENLYEGASEKEKIVFSRLLEKQLALFSTPKKVYETEVIIKAGDYFFKGILPKAIESEIEQYCSLNENRDNQEKKVALQSVKPVPVKIKMPEPYTAAGLVTYLRIHAFRNVHIMEILDELDCGRFGQITYLNNYDGYYLVRKGDRKIIGNLSASLRGFSLAESIDLFLQQFQDGKLSENEYIQKVKELVYAIRKRIERGE